LFVVRIGTIRLPSYGGRGRAALQKWKHQFILKNLILNKKLFSGNIYHTLFTAQDAEDRCYADSFAELQVV
jgi:hypothetical protein